MTFPTDGGAPFVSSLSFDVQADIQSGLPYDPLIQVKEHDCWPSKPKWDHLKNLDKGGDVDGGIDFESFFDRGRVGTRILTVTNDFDYVVLGIGKGAIKYVCSEILKNAGPVGTRWKNMVRFVPTIPTQAFQVWLHADMATLGWHDQSVTLTGIPGTFDTWADMRQVVPREGWEPGKEPLSVAYFCGPLRRNTADNPEDAPPHDTPPPKDREGRTHAQRRLARVRMNAETFLGTQMVHLWRNAGAPGAFDWKLLVDPNDVSEKDRDGASAIASQYTVANINPSDQYVLATAGSIRYRISPLDTGIDNMTIAGDWTACGFTEGCVEAAVMSGKLASHAISQLPKLTDIVGYDHP
jgi:hypothetical protein